MEGLGFAKSKEYWIRFGWGILLGLLSALGAFIFVAIMDFGIGLLWPEPPDPAFFSGSWQIVAIMTGGGFLVGLIHQFSDSREVNPFTAMGRPQHVDSARVSVRAVLTFAAAMHSREQPHLSAIGAMREAVTHSMQ